MASVSLGIAALVAAAIYGFGILQIPPKVFGDPLGPRVFPLLILGALLVVAVCLLIEGARNGPWKESAKSFAAFVRTDLSVVAGVAAWLLLFYVALRPVGYMISVAVFLTGLMLFFYHGRRWISVVTAISFSVVSYFLFARLFEVPLPAGISPI